MSITRRHLLAAAPLVQTARRTAPARTSVVLFMTDDHGAWALGCYGCASMHTPNIDRLAQGGALFTRAYAATPVCSPSRMTWITGKLPSQHGVQDWLRPVNSFGPQSERWLEGHRTYSEVLAENGYTLGMCGKWHMGKDETAQAGFSYWATIPGGGGPYKDPEFVVNGETRKMTGYKTDLVTDFALEFLSRQKPGRPFYLLVPYYAPHTPYNYQPEKYRKPYAEGRFPCFPETPPHPWQNKGLSPHHRNRESMRAYSALITGVDHNLGRVVKRLEEMGLRQDTTVVFTADQGWNAGHHGVWGKGNGTWPLNMYEESIRVPLIWNHPGRIRAGQKLPPLVSSYDYFDTILDYLGIQPPKDPARVGRSYAGFLRGRRPSWRDRLFFEYEHARAVRTENLKYIQRTGGFPSEMFDLEADPGETRNVIAEAGHQRQREALHAQLTGFFERLGAPPIEEWRKTTRQELTVYGR